MFLGLSDAHGKARCAGQANDVISNKFTNKQIAFTVGLLSFVCKFTVLNQSEIYGMRICFIRISYSTVRIYYVSKSIITAEIITKTVAAADTVNEAVAGAYC